MRNPRAIRRDHRSLSRRNVTEGRRDAAVWVATCGGVGYFPIAPGTAGSAVGIVLVAAIGRAGLGPGGSWALLAAAAVSILVVGVWAAGRAEKFFGRTDPGHVVIDEVAGQVITFLAQPEASWKWLLAGFVLFRVFDVLKPFPVRQAERLPRGWGIMADDVLAGLYSLAVLAVLGHLLK
jgi:phosphatidylglycerophosphatase A